MELKIQCDCGTKYKFEFEPVDGCVPFTVNCPGCGKDATAFANSRIQEERSSEVAPSPSSEPKLRVRLNIPVAAHDAPHDSASAAPPVTAPSPRQFTPPAFSAYTPPDEGLSSKFFLGLLGALLGVILGCAIWYLIFHFTGSRLRILALLVGFTGGLGAKLLSKDEGSAQLGMITAVFVLVGILFTGYAIGRERMHKFVGGFENEIYKETTAYAKRAIAAVPNGTEEEIRLFLAREYAEEDETPDPASIDADEVRLFRDVHLGQLKELASGKIGEKDFFKVQQRWLHEEEVAEAKHVLASMPKETDREIQIYLAKEYADEGAVPDPNGIDQSTIKDFRENTLPEMKALANGEVSFQEDVEIQEPGKVLEETEKASGAWMKFIYFFAGWGIGGVGLIFITLGLAYKISTHAAG